MGVFCVFCGSFLSYAIAMGRGIFQRNATFFRVMRLTKLRQSVGRSTVMKCKQPVVMACALAAMLAGFSTLLRAQQEDPVPHPPVITPAAAAQAGGGTYNDPVVI